MTTLHLGVLVQPYETYDRGQTTGDVAEILEAEYGIMGAFWRVHGDEIAKDMETGLQHSMDALLSGEPHIENPFGSAMAATEHRFKRFISSQEVERVGIPGTPTKAALKGVNHRKKHPYAKANARRPSFRDSGLYEASFKAWLTNG